jgi:hypothetical protein
MHSRLCDSSTCRRPKRVVEALTRVGLEVPEPPNWGKLPRLLARTWGTSLSHIEQSTLDDKTRAQQPQ